MIVKKKRTYKKQRGGITQIDRIMIPFFNIINKLIYICSIFITAIFKKSIVFSNKNIAFLNISVKTIKHQPSL